MEIPTPAGPPRELVELFKSATGIGYVPESSWRRWWSTCLGRARSTSPAKIEAYLRGAVASPEERARLLVTVMSPHTRWFRDKAQLREIIKHLKACGARPLRVWSAGCSTGEEPLSLIALFDEHALAPVDLLATDLSAESVAATRALARPNHEKRLRIARHDLIHEPPPETGFDAIVCRNVLMYYEAGVARAALKALRGALSRQGRVFLSGADLLGLGRDLEPIERIRVAPAIEPEGTKHPLPAPEIGEPSPRPAPTLSDLLAEGSAAVRSRHFERALGLYHRAEAMAPDRPETHYLLGVAHRKNGDHTAALASLRRATYLDPTLWRAFVLLADEWRRKGHPDRAEAAQRQAERLLVEPAPGSSASTLETSLGQRLALANRDPSRP